MQALAEWLNSVWVVWLMALFLGIVVWTMWPNRRRKLEDEYSRIPLRDDEER